MTHSIDWTLESGPEDAPNVLEVTIQYSFRWGSLDSWYEPGDPPEAEIEEVYYEPPTPNAPQEPGYYELSLTPAEEQKVLDHIYQNPPEPDEPDYDWSY